MSLHENTPSKLSYAELCHFQPFTRQSWTSARLHVRACAWLEGHAQVWCGTQSVAAARARPCRFRGRSRRGVWTHRGHAVDTPRRQRGRHCIIDSQSPPRLRCCASRAGLRCVCTLSLENDTASTPGFLPSIRDGPITRKGSRAILFSVKLKQYANNNTRGTRCLGGRVVAERCVSKLWTAFFLFFLLFTTD